MRTASLLNILAALALGAAVAPAVRAQAPAPVSIPLELTAVSGAYYRLVINVGINGGTPQPYMFDTGSAPFAAAFNPNTWGGFAGQTSVPSSPFPNGNNVSYCYGGGTACDTGSTLGNRLQIQSLSFPGTSPGTVVTLAANPGYAVDALSQLTASSGTTYSFPGYFDDPNAKPPFDELFGPFYGVFGAGNFAQNTLGGVLGQTIVAGVTQGYVVAANGQSNPASSVNPPQKVQGIEVSVGGQTRSVTACSPCVTVGLTPQMIGQFAPVGLPATTGRAGVIPLPSSTPFNNPYVPIGTAPGNNGSLQYGATFTVSLTPPGGTAPAVSSTHGTLLDTGTPSNYLSDTLDTSAVATEGGKVLGGVTLAAVATTGSGSSTPVPGLTTSSAVMTRDATPNTYDATFASSDRGIIGIGFFLQNSVMYDLSNNVIGYTPFFVTDAALATTANGPLIVNGGNVPLGLAGVVSGPGGVTVEAGGAVQLSATNSYTGLTTIAAASGAAAAGQLLVSGPGSIASSAGVVNNGVLDISRAWAPIVIQALSGGGQVYLGGQNLTIGNASGIFSGTITDGGSYPGTGGSLTVAGGTQTLAGNNSYTGGTVVSGGTLALTGTMIGSLSIQAGATFTTTGGWALTAGNSFTSSGTFQSLGTAPLVNQGTLINNGTMTTNLVNAGILGGTGTIAGAVTNNGIVAPGNSIGTLSVTGSYVQAAGSVYQVETNAQGQADRITVNGAPGTATIAGGSAVTVLPQPGSYAPRTTYTILSATGGVAGTYSTISSSLPFLRPSLSYDAQNVYLTLQAGGFAAAAQTPTQAAVGAVLDASAASATGNYATVVGALTALTAPQGQAVMTAISGQNYAGFSSAGVQSAQTFMSNFSAQAGGGSGNGATRVALAQACDVACDATDAGWGAWGGAIGGLGTIGANVPVGGLTYNQAGFAAGLDRQVTPALRLGVTTGFSAGTQWVSGFQGSGTSNTLQAGLYGSFTQGAFHLDGLAGYAYSANQMQRPIAIPGLAPMTAIGQTGANQFFGQLEAGYRVELGGTANAFVMPFARLQGATSTQNAFRESGAGALGLSVAAQTTNSLRSVLGAQIGGAMDLGWRDRLAVQLRLGWSHEYADTGRPVTAAFAGAPALAFTTYGASPQRDGVLVGLAANTAVADRTSLYLRYEGDFSGPDSSNALTAGVRLTW